MTTHAPDGSTARPSRPAATVVLTRESQKSSCGVEALLLRRSDVGAFAGMWVFPGGRVDDADDGHDEMSRAASAAVREAAEEVSARVARESLVTWSHWTPPANAPARFTTWFFVAPWDGGEIAIDGHEIVDHAWMAPEDALQAGLPMAPPTIVTLHEMLEAGSAESIWRGRSTPPAYVTRPAMTQDGIAVLLWQGDAGYDSGDANLDGPRNRLIMPEGFGSPVFQYLRSS